MNHPRSDEHAPYPADALLHGWLSNPGARTPPIDAVRIDATGLADPNLGCIEHASLVVSRVNEVVQIAYAGSTSQVPAQFNDPKVPVFTLRDQLIMPAFVNAHTHLDLTHIGPQPHEPDDGFVSWVNMIREQRASDDEHITQCVRLGIERSLAGGVIAVGDIAGAPAGRLTDAPIRTLAHSPMLGVSYLEFFGIGKTAAAAIRRVEAFLDEHAPAILDSIADSGVQLGLQPHATNTIDLSVYRWVAQAAASRGLPLSTHLAETPEEREFIAQGTGPQRELLERLGVWDDSILDHIAKGNHPIEHLRSVLETRQMLVAHVNDATDAGIELLAETKTSVAYCPRGSSYFGAASHFGPHRYAEMLDAGVNVCLGTDSIVNLDTTYRISTLDEIRMLWKQGDHDANQLLSMGTINGARALGLSEQLFSIQAGSTPAGIIAVPIGEQHDNADPWVRAMMCDSAPTWVFRDE
jgi:cytosine/adenosine deaminase-related metal-dependent hydrolase